MRAAGVGHKYDQVGRVGQGWQARGGNKYQYSTVRSTINTHCRQTYPADWQPVAGAVAAVNCAAVPLYLLLGRTKRTAKASG